MVNLRTQLHDGDTVEILTNANHSPRRDWIDMVVTGKARNRIRQLMRIEGNKRSLELGRGIVERALRKRGTTLSRVIGNGQLDEYAKAHGSGSAEGVLVQVGYGRLDVEELVAKLLPDSESPPELGRTEKIREFIREGMTPGKSGILVSGMNDVLSRFAKCCSPVPGDDITGFITRGRGITVHTRNCSKVFEMDPERRVDVRWDTKANVMHSIRIRVYSNNKQGLLASVTKAIAGLKVDIEGAHIQTSEDNKAVLTFDVSVPHLRSLEGLMKRIERIPGVLTVERVHS